MTCQRCRIFTNAKSGNKQKIFARQLTHIETDPKKKIQNKKLDRVSERGGGQSWKIEYMQNEQACGLAASHSFSSACPVPLTSY